MKKNLKFLIPLIFTLVLLIIIKSIQPDEINWQDSYTSKDKIPFGCYVAFDLLREIFPGEGNKIKSVYLPVYNSLRDKYYYNTNYIFINTSFTPDRLDIEMLLEFLKNGNDVFISASAFNRDIQDSLNFSTYYSFFDSDTSVINFTDEDIKTTEGYKYKEGYSGSYFATYDTSKAQILAVDSSGNNVFFRMKYGRGNIYLCSIPSVFTNYYLLKKETNEFAFKSLSYLKDQDVIWDEYYKAGNKYASTPLRFIISQSALAWAYYLILIGVVIFIIFYGRRRQRRIPIIKPFDNTTLEFVSIVSNLYYQQNNHSTIAQKNSVFFFDYLRQKYFINTNIMDDKEIKLVSEKTNYSFEKLKSLVQTLKATFNRKNITDSELVYLNNRIEDFYKKTGKYGRKNI
jgi:Domain of unknown function (DUF4350)